MKIPSYDHFSIPWIAWNVLVQNSTSQGDWWENLNKKRRSSPAKTAAWGAFWFSKDIMMLLMIWLAFSSLEETLVKAMLSAWRPAGLWGPGCQAVIAPTISSQSSFAKKPQSAGDANVWRLSPNRPACQEGRPYLGSHLKSQTCLDPRLLCRQNSRQGLIKFSTPNTK